MASSDASPRSTYAAAYRVTFPIFDADGDLVTGATGLDSEVSKDGGTFADCTNEATEIATSSGIYYLDLTSTEMTADTVAVIVKTTSVGAKTTVLVMYPEASAMLPVNVAQWDGTNVATPATAGIPDVNVKNAANVAWASGAITAASIATDAITAAKIATDSITAAKIAADAIGASELAADAVTEIAAGITIPSAAAIADAVLDEDMTAHQTQGSLGQAIGDPVADTNTIYKAVVTDAAGATVGVDVVAVKADTAAILIDTAEIGAAGAGLTALATQASVNTIDDLLDTEIPALTSELAKVPKSDGTATWNATALASLQQEATDALNAYDPPTRAEATTDANSILAVVNIIKAGLVLATDTVGADATTTSMVLGVLPYGNDEINDHLLVIRDVSANEYHARWISDWIAANTTAVVATLPFTPEDGVDTVEILSIRRDVTGGSGLDAAGVRAAVGLASANLDTQLGAIDDLLDTEVPALTSELAKVPKSDGTATWNATALAAIQSEANDALVAYDPPTFAELDARTDAIDAALAAIQSDTDNIQTRLPAALVSGTSDSGTTLTMVDAARTEADTDYWIGCWIRFTSGNITGQVRLITAFTPASDTITFTPATTQAVGTQTYEILPAAAISSVRSLDTGAITADSFASGAILTGAEVQSECNDALEAIHLDHLLAVEYDPASKPGVATALLNEIIGSDAGVSQLTANALELAPTGGSAPTVGEIADAVWDEDATAHQTTGTFGQAIGDPVADTNSIYKAVVTDAAGATVGVDVVAVKADTAAILTDTAALPNNGALTTIQADLDDLQTKIGTPAGASVSADIAAIEAQTDDIGVAGAGLTAIPWNAAWDAEVQSEATDALVAYDPPTGAELVSEINAVQSDIAALNNLSAAAAADAVWDETLSGHLGAGSTGNALNAAGSAGDPWATALPGAYGAGTAGKMIGDNVNATISSRATQTSVDDLPTNAELATALGTADDAVLTQVALVKAKTDNLPADPADASDIAALFATVNSKLDTIDDLVDTEVGAIKTVTDKLDTAVELDGAVYRFTTNALEQAPTGGGGGLDAAGVRAAVGLASANLDTQLADLPTNAELATALGTADDAVLAAINDLPTNAELATALGTADDAVLTAIDALPTNAELATALADVPTTAEIATAIATRVTEDSMTYEEMYRIIFSVAAGKANGLTGATPTFRDAADTKDRLVSALAGGNRTITSTDGT